MKRMITLAEILALLVLVTGCGGGVKRSCCTNGKGATPTNGFVTCPTTVNPNTQKCTTNHGGKCDASPGLGGCVCLVDTRANVCRCSEIQ